MRAPLRSSPTLLTVALLTALSIAGCGSAGSVEDPSADSAEDIQQAEGQLAGASCEGINTDDVFDDNTGSSPNLNLWEWIPTQSVTIHRIEVFTGESTSLMQVGLWSDDGTGKPLAPIAYSAPVRTKSLNSWQGAPLNAPVAVTAGTRYWVAWYPHGGGQTPVTSALGAVKVPYYGCGPSVANCQYLSGPFAPVGWKYRMYCGPHCVTMGLGDTALGTLEDAEVNSATPSTALGTQTSAKVGGTSKTLVSVDLSQVPVWSKVTSATLNFPKAQAATTLLGEVHRVSVPWTESTVTWNSIGTGIDYYVYTSASFPTNGAAAFDLTSLANAWLGGFFPNYGIALVEGANVGTLRTSETFVGTNRPSIDICYTP